jgi:D-beta-D-heptose 7-phosphate kinase/D-beta-D-heptose 1-phosphate adenosyltransferase
MTGLAGIIDRMRGLRILVIGEAMLDSYLEGVAGRLCREAPVPIVDVATRTDAPGGAANTAVNLCALGAEVTLISVAGDDLEGAAVRAGLARAGVDTSRLLHDPARRTLAKHRVVASSQLLLRFDAGTTERVSPEIERALVERIESVAPSCDAIVLSDYGYGVVTPGMTRTLAAMQEHAAKTLVVDSRSLGTYRMLRPSAVKPNYDEATRMLGLPRVEGIDARAEQMAAHGDRLLELSGARMAAITLDADGALVFEREAPPYRTYARPARNSSAAGAGDTFVSALTAALAAGAGATMAAELASAAAAVVVAKDGTSACSADELHAYLTAGDKFVRDYPAFLKRIEFERGQGRRIVFTNGCFDILHRGHIAYLNRAKALGDLLVVGVNSDASVVRLKGPARPVNPLDDRVQVLAALSCVDHIVAFGEDTPERLIEGVRPHVFAKGGDYRRETLPEARLVEQLGGVVQILPYVEDRSTTSIIERIQSANGGDAHGDGTRHDRGSALAARAQRALRPARRDR